MTGDGVTVEVLRDGDAATLMHVDPDVFDHEVRPELVRELLADPRHHLVVAVCDDLVVGFASAVHYVHPDKPAELWVNEVGVAGPWRGQGIGKRLLARLFALGRELGCREAWVLTEHDNLPARQLYAAVGGEETPEPPVMVTFDLRGAR